MDQAIGFVVFLLLFILIGAVLGWVAFIRVNDLRRTVSQLSDELKQLHIKAAVPIPAKTAPVQKQVSPPVETIKPTTDSPSRSTQSTATPPKPRVRPRWEAQLIENWMIWLGGISVALAGVFMVKHSIHAGFLGPKTQITLAILTGLGLHAGADWLRRRNGGSDPVFASLAGGASITLYAALLAALHIYQLIDPRWVFIALAAVSLLTMMMSLIHGPMLAMIGLVGAYVVPVLVNTGSGNMVAALIYSLIISALHYC